MPDPTGLLTDEEIKKAQQTAREEWLKTPEATKLSKGDPFYWNRKMDEINQRAILQAQHSADALAKEQAVVEERKRIGKKIIKIINDGDIYFTKLVAIEEYGNHLKAGEELT